MNTLLIVAHGSRNKSANDEVIRLANALGQTSKIFDRITYAFLELAEPRMKGAVSRLIAEGATGITVFPYFLAGGTHVATDIPARINDARECFPHTPFTILPHLGAIEGVPDLILDHISSTSAAKI